MFVLVLSSPNEVVVPKDDPMVQEISDVLREWNTIWKRLYAVINYLYVYHTPNGLYNQLKH